jgi:hypothetical protein
MTDKADDSFAGKWQNVISAGMFLTLIGGGFWALAYQPISKELDRLDSISKDYISRKEESEYRNRIDSNLLRIDNEIKLLKEAIVPRGEHVEKWRSNELVLESHQRQITDIRKDLGSSYSLGDKIKELQTDINNLRNQK